MEKTSNFKKIKLSFYSAPSCVEFSLLRKLNSLCNYLES